MVDTSDEGRRRWQRDVLSADSRLEMHALGRRVRAGHAEGWAIDNLPRTRMSQSSGVIITTPGGETVVFLEQDLAEDPPGVTARVELVLRRLGYRLPMA